MADIAALEGELALLRDIRSRGVFRARIGEEEITYRTDAELSAAISDLEARISGAQGRAVRTVRFTSSKGL